MPHAFRNRTGSMFYMSPYGPNTGTYARCPAQTLFGLYGRTAFGQHESTRGPELFKEKSKPKF